MHGLDMAPSRRSASAEAGGLRCLAVLPRAEDAEERKDREGVSEREEREAAEDHRRELQCHSERMSEE